MKKINIGFILTILVLIIVVVYNVSLEIGRKNDKIEVQKVCEKYIEFDSQYSMLEENKRTIPKSISDQDYSRYLEDMKSKLTELFVPEEILVNNQYGVLKQNLDTQTADLTYVITSLKRDIIEITKYEFTGNQVKVTISTNIEVKYLEKDKGNNDKVKENVKSGKYTDTISLKKVDGKWKVAYANLQNLLLINQYGVDSPIYMM